jgi:DNA mismatch repair protein MutS
MSARFESILYQQPTDVVDGDEPEFFADLHLDQVRASITAGRDEYQLEPFFHAPQMPAGAFVS